MDRRDFWQLIVRPAIMGGFMGLLAWDMGADLPTLLQELLVGLALFGGFVGGVMIAFRQDRADLCHNWSNRSRPLDRWGMLAG